MSAHRIRAGQFARAGGRQGLRAECECGWTAIRISLSEKQCWEDARAHVSAAELAASSSHRLTTTVAVDQPELWDPART